MTSVPRGPADRPMSPHLTVWRWHVTMLASILVRISGGALAVGALFVVMALMFIGGASGSTAGGIKVNTFAVLIIAIISTVKGEPSATAFGRRIKHAIVYRALAVLILGLGPVDWRGEIRRLPAEAVRALGTSPQEQAVQATVAASGLSLPVVVHERSQRDTRSNAVVHGLGPTRRMVIDDTRLARPVDEVVAVVAHELAHQQLRDVERAVLASAILMGLLAVAVRWGWTDPTARRAMGLD